MDFILKLPVQNLIALLIFVVLYVGYQLGKELKRINDQLADFRSEWKRREF